MDEEFIEQMVERLSSAIRNIAHGGVDGPDGLEGLGIAISGDGLRHNLCDSITSCGESIKEGLESVAESIQELAAAISELKTKKE